MLQRVYEQHCVVYAVLYNERERNHSISSKAPTSSTTTLCKSEVVSIALISPVITGL